MRPLPDDLSLSNPFTEDEFRPRRVLLVDTVAGAGAQTEQPSLKWLSARASALWRSRLQPASVGLEKLCSFDLVRLPGNTTAGASDDTSSQGAQLLLRFGKPEAPNSLLVRPRMVPTEIGLSSLPCLVSELQHNIRLRRAEWGEATRSELAASAARKLADGAAASLTRAQTDELRPLDNFQERVRNLRTQANILATPHRARPPRSSASGVCPAGVGGFPADGGAGLHAGVRAEEGGDGPLFDGDAASTCAQACRGAEGDFDR